MRVCLLIVSLILVAAAGIVFGNNTAKGVERGMDKGASVQAFEARLDERVPGMMQAYGIPGANIALIKGGETVLRKAYGYADLGTGSKMTTDTILRVESISKPVTAWGVMKLVEQGRLELDVPVRKYLKNWRLPESAFAEEKITVRQLLSHTAGMPLGDIFNRFSPEEGMPSLEESLTKEAVPNREPGSSFSYSNTGFNLLEILIEEVTGRDFAEYMEQEVLIPLGMEGAGFIWSETFDPPVPYGYDLAGNPVPFYVYPEKASGGLLARVGDIAAFVAAGMPEFTPQNPVLSPRSMELLYTPAVANLGVYGLVFDAYGLGYYLENLSDGRKAVAHGGQGAGWMTHFHTVPETGDGIVILTNSQRSWPFMAGLLNDWTKWSGLSPVGMSRIIPANAGIWALALLGWAIALLLVWRSARMIVAEKNRPIPARRKFSPGCWAQSGLALIIVAVLMWCGNQDYLLISSVFPVVSYWLGISALVLAAGLMLSVLLSALARRKYCERGKRI